MPVLATSFSMNFCATKLLLRWSSFHLAYFFYKAFGTYGAKEPEICITCKMVNFREAKIRWLLFTDFAPCIKEKYLRHMVNLI